MKTDLPGNTLSHPTAEQVVSFVNKLERAYMLDRPRKHGTERRAVERLSLTVPITVAPLNDDLHPLGYEHHAVTRDISSKGVGLVTTNPVPPSYVLLTLDPCQYKPFRVIGRVAYCNEVGYYYRIGCEFLFS